MVPDFARCLAILDTMWGGVGEADRWFPISPMNHSGKRLYSLTGLRFPQVWVTNSCREYGATALDHGKSNPNWLLSNLEGLSGAVKLLPLLVCGAVAKRTYGKCGYAHPGPVRFLLHPAARTWTKESLRMTGEELKGLMLGGGEWATLT